MGVENQQQNNNGEFKSNDILYVVSKEIHELTDAKNDNNNIDLKQLDDNISRNFVDELKKALEKKPLILDHLLDTCKGYIDKNPNHGDEELTKLYDILKNINNSRTSNENETESVTQNTSETKDITLSKEQAEIQQDNINVTLRGEWSEESWKEKKGITRTEVTPEEKQEYNTFLEAGKQKITKELNKWVDKRDTLDDNQKTVLILTKHALESISHNNEKGEPVNGEVLVLERKLNELGYMPEIPNNGNNGIDGKFGTKTYEAIINCMEGKLTNTTKEQAEIQQDNIKVTLRGEWSKDKWMEKNNRKEGNNDTNEKDYEKFLAEEKDKITEKLNSYQDKRDTLDDNQKTVLIWAKYALESTSHDDGQGNPVSDEVLRLERKLNELGYMPSQATDGRNNGPDGKFGTETYNALIKYLDGTSNENSGDSNSDDKGIDTNNDTPEDISQANEQQAGESRDSASPETATTQTPEVAENTSTPSSTAETGKQKKNDPFERVTNVIDRLSDFEWEKGGGFFNNMKNLLAAFGGKGFEGMLQKNPNIEDDNTVLTILSEVKKARKIRGLDYIKDIIKNGGSNEIKELQFNLWTPENKLSITGKIDTATATALKYYIGDKNNTGNSDAVLNRPILTMGYEAQPGTLNNVEVEGTLYKKASGSSVDGYIFEGKDHKFITADIEDDDSGNLKLKDRATIQYADGTREEGSFDKNLKLTDGTRYDSNHPNGQQIRDGKVEEQKPDSDEGNENDSTEATPSGDETSEGSATPTTSEDS